ncbi:MAG: flagellar biosynthesis protein FlhA [Planctomycetes bacterium]|nr:flagellar biosynthesis protein FlhA [Planctomycetota bacterium]
MASVADKRLIQWGTKVNRNLDIPLVIAIILVLFTIIVPLPPFLMDLLLVINITISMIILVTTIYIVHPLDFNVFPSMLLLTTFYRLALNVATTRLILSRAGTDHMAAAGQVVMAFGNFVAGSNAVVGFVIFAIIFIIQFVVITKGATRISEVAARFILDAMPGKQLSIDADLNAGLINEDDARRRRQQINREADFYGAMDGASKFVRGDAIAGIIITLINIFGGFIIGYTQYNMTIADALQVYTILTIGDGLVSQLPALVTSIASGLLITRNTAESNLGKDFFGQLMGNSKAMYIVGGFLLFLIPSGLPQGVLVSGALCCFAIGYILKKVQIESQMQVVKEAVKKEEKSPTEKARALLSIDPLELEIGYGLIGLVDQSQGGSLLNRISLIREQIALELGFVVPAVRIRDNMQLESQEYCLKLKGVPVARWKVYPGQYLAMDSGVVSEKIEGIPTLEPAFNLPAVWIPEAHKGRAESLGYTVVDATSVIATHLTEVIRLHASDLLNRDEVATLIQNVKERSPALVNELIPDVLKNGDVQKVLQNLLNERVSIRDLETILEALGDYAPRTKDTEVLTEYVRNALGRNVCQQHRHTDGKLHVITLDPSLEDFINNSIEHTERGSYMTLSPEMLSMIVSRIAAQVERMVVDGHSPIILCAPQVRLQVRKMLEGRIPGIVVLSYNEIVKEVQVESHGTVTVDKT